MSSSDASPSADTTVWALVLAVALLGYRFEEYVNPRLQERSG